jgi:diadenosine tetraphosphate (Ap4A) HIT family hydrolase
LKKVLLQPDLLPLKFPGMEAIDRRTMYLMGCRSFEQYCCSLRAFANPQIFCPFCSTELERRGRRAIHEYGNWMLLQNEFPHKNVQRMLLIVPIRHLTEIAELVPSDWNSIGRLIELSGIASGGVMFRFGDPHLNVGTIDHLHINIIEPICGKQYRAPFAKDVGEHEEDYSRLLRFQQELWQHNDPSEWLFSHEGISATQPVL